MRNIIAFIALFVIFITAFLFANVAYGQKEFSKLVNSTDSSYGYTVQNTLKMKKGNQEKSMAYSYSFLKGLKTQDDQALKLLFQATVSDPDYKQPKIKINNRFTGMPINGKLGLLDEYVFLTSKTKDTLRIFIDVYNKGPLLLPVGLKYEEQPK